MMNYHSAAKTLDGLMMELIKKGIEIPAHVVGDLKSGRSFAGILLRSPDDTEVAEKTGFILETVEMNLLSLAEIEFGADYAETWQKAIIAAYQEEIVPAASASASKLVSGVPKDERWVRVQTSELTAFYEHEPDKTPETFGLSTVGQQDGYTLIYGKRENVTAFLNRMKEFYRKTKK